MEQVYYSIIIPHHDTPKLLKRCLDSIPERDDTEIIIIDDNSSPSVVDFSHFPGYDRKSVNIIFTKEGRGAGYARNCGLAVAKGHWLLFADADDLFTPQINVVLDDFKNDEFYDIVFFNVMKFDERGYSWKINWGRIIHNYLKKRPFSELALRYEYWTPWSRMFKRENIYKYNISFEELPIGNDMMFVLNATKYAKNIIALKEVVYMYYWPSYGSQTTNKYSRENRLLRLEARFKLRNFYREVNFPFMFPIIRNFSVFSDNTIQNLLIKYHYNFWEDIYNYIKYVLAKLLRII